MGRILIFSDLFLANSRVKSGGIVNFRKHSKQYSRPVLGMSLRKVTSLGSILASVTDFKELKLNTVYVVISEATRPLQLVGQVAEPPNSLSLGPKTL